jgi:FkbM family methyltransferase
VISSSRSIAKGFLRQIAPRDVLDFLELRWAIRSNPIIPKLLALVDRGRCAIDVGANVGLYTLAFHKRVGKVIAFEPLPALATGLRRRFGPGVQVLEVALSDRNGTTRLFLPHEGRRAIASRASLNDDANPGFTLRPLKVETRRLDDYGFDDVGIIKIDVEGHEFAMLRGAEQTIRQCRPVLVVEIEERHHPGRSWDIIHYILGIGYAGSFLRDNCLVGIEQFDFGAMQNENSAKKPFAGRSGEYINNFVFVPHP